VPGKHACQWINGVNYVSDEAEEAELIGDALHGLEDHGDVLVEVDAGFLSPSDDILCRTPRAKGFSFIRLLIEVTSTDSRHRIPLDLPRAAQ
jgi:hypothetical protein